MSGSDSFAACTSAIEPQPVVVCPMVDNCQEVGLDTSEVCAAGVLGYLDGSTLVFDLEVTDSAYSMQPDTLGNPQRFSESYVYSRYADTLVLQQYGDGIDVKRIMVRK